MFVIPPIAGLKLVQTYVRSYFADGMPLEVLVTTQKIFPSLRVYSTTRMSWYFAILSLHVAEKWIRSLPA